MPAQIPTNISPYFDDFDEKKNFYRTLFKAGYPVQARELTQSQTVLQDQIEKLASRFLKDGDNVVPGEFSLLVPSPYIRAAEITQGATAAEFIGYSLTGTTSQVKATVLFATEETDEDDVTFYLTYESSGNTSEYTTFIEGETLESNTPNRYTATVGVNGVSKPLTSDAIGKGSLFKVSGGSYYVNGFMVRNDEQTITLDKYGVSPSYEVGFNVIEEFITSAEDPSLLDNAQGSSNFAAPGADRLKISLILKKREEGESDANFILLATLQQGNLIGKPDQTIKWAWLYDILAKRTYDESGDYIAEDFPFSVLEYWNGDEVNGVFDADEDGNYPAIPNSGRDEPLTQSEADNTYVAKIDSGLAYVQGYECGFKHPIQVFGDKPRTVTFEENNVVKITQGYNVPVTHANSHPDIQNINADQNAEAFNPVICYRNFNDGHVGQLTDNMGNRPLDTYHVVCDGDIGSIDGGHQVVYQGTNSAVVTSATELDRGDSIDSGNSTILYAIPVTPVPSGVIYPRYFTPDVTITDDASGLETVDSTYRLGASVSKFFTEISIIPDEATEDQDWVIGNQITGSTSRAIGIVESGTTDRILVVSNVIGEFVPGEEVYQENKKSTILKPGEVAGFLFTDAGDLSATTSLTVTALGASTTLSVAGNHLVVDGQKINITKEGRDKLYKFPFVQYVDDSVLIDYQVVTNGGIKGFGVIPNLKITNTLTKTKSFYSTLASTSIDEFSADISTRNTADADITTIGNSKLYRGTKDTNFLVSNSISSDPSKSLVSGDVVSFTDDTGAEVRKVVLFATEPYDFGGQSFKAKIYFTTTLENSVSGDQVSRIRVRSQGKPEDSLVFQLPQDVVKSLETDPLTTRIKYYIFREFVIKVNAGASEVAVETSRDNEFFTGDNDRSMVSIMKTSVANAATLEGTFINIDADAIDVQDGGKKLVLPFSGFQVPGGESEMVLKVTVPVFVENAKAKIKRYMENQEVTIPQATAEQFKVVSLGKADVYTINSITMGGVDVTNRYTLDNGQRNNVYELATITRITGGVTSDLVVNFDYFQHENEGDFFSVDSYTHDNGVDYSGIPVFESSSGSNDGRILTYLRDCVDFRPIVDSINTKIASITDAIDEQDSTSFKDLSNGGDGFVPRIPIPGTYFVADVQFYLPKIDSLFLEKTGALTLIPGDPSEAPVPPSDIATGIRLYDITMPAYLFSVDDVKVKKYNYKRFRMSDIHDIEKRVDRVEELVTLSILEQNAINFNVRDAVTGLDRFKNGIVVDPFEDHSRGDTDFDQYRNSIDADNSVLRAPHFTDQVELEEKEMTDDARLEKHYVNNEDIITLPYENKQFLRNPFATRSVNLQPYAVFTYDGELYLTPQIDTWKEVKRQAPLIIEDNHLYDAARDLSETMAKSGIGTVWGDWRKGKTTKSTKITEFRGSGTKKQRSAQRAAYVRKLKAQGIKVSTSERAARSPSGITRPVRVTTTTSRTELNRKGTSTRLNVSTDRIVKTSYGDRVVDTSLARIMRTRPVKFQAYRLKPNTRYYVFFDDIEVTDWVSPDTMSIVDGVKRYTGTAGKTNRGFGQSVVSDDVGTITGIFLVPNGRAPVSNQRYSSLSRVQYQKTGSTRSFPTGTRTLRFTSDPQNSSDVSKIEAYAERTYTASGVLLDKEETIVSTRVPEFNYVRTTITSPTRVIEKQEKKANYFDPLAQTFMIDADRYQDGVFVSEIDAFFETKDPSQGMELYLVSTEGEVPTSSIIPRSRINKRSNSILRVRCTLGGTGIISSQLKKGITIRGKTSGATGVLFSTRTFNSPAVNPEVNVNNTVYSVILSNYKGDFIPGEVIERSDPRIVAGAVDQSRFTIVGNELDVTRVDIRAIGKDYGSNGDGTFSADNLTVEFSDPQLPGGTAATGIVKVDSQGRVYDFELTDPGSGYTKVPSATIVDSTGSGSGAILSVRVENGREAVEMGVSTSSDGTAATTFKFRNPMYLMPGEIYAFVLKAPTSLKYKAWTSKLGENLVGTQTRVVEQPSLGSLFMSQNGGLWTADQTQDIKFEMRRADFERNTEATITLQNMPLETEALDVDPIETNSSTGSGSDLFGDNPRIVEIYHPNHGLNVGDLVEISGVTQDIGGIPFAEFNDVHTVIANDFMKYTIKVTTMATSSERGGGDEMRASFGRPYEVIDVYTGAMKFANTELNVSNRATYSSAISSTLSNEYTRDDLVPINFDEEYYYNGPRQVGNYLNEAKNRGSSKLRGDRSLQTIVKMITFNGEVSPVLDLQRTNAIVSRNLIDNPTPTDPIFGPITATVTTSNAFTADDVPDTLSFGDKSLVVDKVLPNIKTLELRGAPGTYDPTSIVGTFNSFDPNNVSVSSGEDYIPETKQNGSTYAKWLSRMFLFENDCDGLELKLSACFYNTTDIKCYFRPRNIGFDGDISDINWIPFNPSQEFLTADASGNVSRNVVPGLPDNVNSIEPRSYPDVDPTMIEESEWQSLTFSAQDLARFDGVAIKIVMTSENPAKAPLIDDFMLICSE